MRTLLLTLALTSAPLAAQAADTYTIDPGHTYAHFAINHLGFSTMRGRIDSISGSFTLDAEAKTGSVEVSLDPASIDTGHQKRDDHLRSPDFLNVVEFPDMSYQSSAVTLTDSGGTIEGSLTLMGTTKPVSLTITGRHCGPHPFNKKETCGFDATATVKRTDFGSNYGVPAIGDEMQLWLEIEGAKN